MTGWKQIHDREVDGMWIVKSCPRCRGNLFLDEDVGASFEKCLQCGYEKEVQHRTNRVENQLEKKIKVGIK
jgi:DNA-directed RNA polymerase subunit M/transcription elongation factor TFIIS